MIMPSYGDEISVIPYGTAVVDKVIGKGKCIVTLARWIQRPDGGITNQVIVELHPIWTVTEMML